MSVTRREIAALAAARNDMRRAVATLRNNDSRDSAGKARRRADRGLPAHLYGRAKVTGGGKAAHVYCTA